MKLTSIVTPLHTIQEKGQTHESTLISRMPHWFVTHRTVSWGEKALRRIKYLMDSNNYLRRNRASEACFIGIHVRTSIPLMPHGHKILDGQLLLTHRRSPTSVSSLMRPPQGGKIPLTQNRRAVNAAFFCLSCQNS